VASPASTVPPSDTRQVVCPPPPLVRHCGKAAGHSLLSVQIWRLPDDPQADCIWQVPPPPWQQTAGAVQSLDEAQLAPPLLDPEPPLLLPPLLPPPPLLLLLTPPDDDEAGDPQAPATQVVPWFVQSEQRSPFLPHALSTWPVTHEPVLSQHPVVQFWAVHPPLMPLDDPPAPLELAVPSDEDPEPSSDP
jgi:hypothetical protein